MGRADIEDTKLAEVKAILARLQRMSPDDELLVPVSVPEIVVRAALAIETLARPAAPPLPIEVATTSKARLVMAVLAGSALAAVLLFVSRPYWLPVPPTTVASSTPITIPALPPSAPPVNLASPPPVASIPAPAQPLIEAPTLQSADQLIRAGRLVAGRAQLLRIAPEQSADVAWALARTFDPAVVGRIENADAPPNVDEAAKWYRQWHALAVRQGLVADSVSIDRMIRAMRQ